ncbi:23S rRNA (pseudouridine(1915)-N(3))-methyltransferase RlmH [Streptococcus dentasini]
MKVKVITVGKLKEAYLKDGIAEYRKRLNRFSKIELIELPDEKIPDKASSAEIKQIFEKEAERIMTKVAERDFVIALAIEGDEWSSEEFSQKLADTALRGYSDFTFIIGGSLGLANRVKKRANLLMSFGKLTLPHQLMRLILMEQIYRAFMIQAGSPYHK